MSWTIDGVVASGDGSFGLSYGPTALHVRYRTDMLSHSATETALSPLVLRDAPGQALMRLYCIVPNDFLNYGQILDGNIPFRGGISRCKSSSPWARRHKTIEKRLGYMDSKRFDIDLVTASGFPGYIQVDKNSSTPELFETCIPGTVLDITASYAVIVDAATGAYYVRTDPAVTPSDPADTPNPGDFAQRKYRLNTFSGEAHVVAIPDGGGYLMVLTQYLQLANEDGTSNGANPYNSRTQIIAWWSDGPEFCSAQTAGPFLFVDESRCLSDDQTFRMWVGSPSVAVIRDSNGELSLYVYYVVERSYLGYSDPKGNPPLRDAISITEYDDAFALWQTLHGTFTQGLACKRINWKHFRDTLLLPELAAGRRGRVLEATNDLHWDLRPVAEGDLLGMVRFWISDGTTVSLGMRSKPALSARPFFNVFRPEYAKAAAPHAVSCDYDLQSLSLYIPVTIAEGAQEGYVPTPPDPSKRDIGTGHGIWRTRALPDARWLYDSRNRNFAPVQAGLDFVVAPIDGTTYQSPDMLVASDDKKLYIDPGVVQLPDGSWWALMGSRLINSSGAPSPGPVLAYAGTQEDGCATWRALYDGAVGVGVGVRRAELPQPGGFPVAALSPTIPHGMS